MVLMGIFDDELVWNEFLKNGLPVVEIFFVIWAAAMVLLGAFCVICIDTKEKAKVIFKKGFWIVTGVLLGLVLLSCINLDSLFLFALFAFIAFNAIGLLL